MESKFQPKTVEEYLAALSPELRSVLEEVRATIIAAAPEAEECISYQMPAYRLKGPLVYFAAWQNHVGFYPAPRGLEEFKDELASYKGAKGSVQFPLDRPMPLDLIRRIVEFRVAENLANAASKAKGKKRG